MRSSQATRLGREEKNQSQIKSKKNEKSYIVILLGFH